MRATSTATQPRLSRQKRLQSITYHCEPLRDSREPLRVAAAQEGDGYPEHSTQACDASDHACVCRLDAHHHQCAADGHEGEVPHEHAEVLRRPAAAHVHAQTGQPAREHQPPADQGSGMRRPPAELRGVVKRHV
eukprot:4539741-Prymnesium_polylepis.3